MKQVFGAKRWGGLPDLRLHGCRFAPIGVRRSNDTPVALQRSREPGGGIRQTGRRFRDYSKTGSHRESPVNSFLTSTTASVYRAFLGDLPPNSPGRQQLQDLRLLLDDRQRQLSGALFQENTANFQAATDELRAINGDLKQTIADVKKLQDTINNVNRFLGALTNLVTAAGRVI